MSVKDLPSELVSQPSSLIDAFVLVAEVEAETRANALTIFERLPEPLRAAEAFYDRLTQRWRYDFGRPLEFDTSSQVVLGTHQWPEVRNLYLALQRSTQRLSPPALSQYLKRLGDPSRHQDVLFEARPLFYLKGLDSVFGRPRRSTRTSR